MSLTLQERIEDTLAAPTELQFWDPFDGVDSKLGEVTDPVVEQVALRPATRRRQPRSVADPAHAQRVEHARAERTAILEQARRLVESALDSPIAFARLAHVAFAAGFTDEAVEAAEAVIRLAGDVMAGDPDSSVIVPIVAAKFTAARVLASVGRGMEAEAVLATLPQGGPWRPFFAHLAARRGEYELALERLSTEDQGYRGYLLLELNRPNEALRSLRAALAEGEDSPALWSNLAFAYASVGSLKKAIVAASRVVVIAPRDRQASFNLASYLRAAGRSADALAELQRLESVVGEGDPIVAAAIAHAYVACGNFREGLRTLRRTKHHNSLPPESIELAELNANLAVLRWRVGELSRLDLLSDIRKQIRLAGPSVDLVHMLAEIGSDRAMVDELQVMRDTLAERHAEARDLSAIDVQIMVLRGDVEEATALAQRLAEDNPLDAAIALTATYLQIYVTGDYAGAAELGLRTLRRFPVYDMLVNNTALALALAGRVVEAEKLIGRIGQDRDNYYLVATKGLVELAKGNIREGLEFYARAGELIGRIEQAEDRSELQFYLRVNKIVALAHFGLDVAASVDNLSVISAPADWAQDARMVLLNLAAERAGVAWVIDDE